MRIVWSSCFLVLGIALQVLSYFVLAAPWGFPPSKVDHSDPRVPFGPVLFIVGVACVLLAAVVYELQPAKRVGKGKEEQPLQRGQP